MGGSRGNRLLDSLPNGAKVKVRGTVQPTTSSGSAQRSLFGLQEEVAEPLMLLLAAQLVLFIGVGAVIPTIPLYGKSIGLTGAQNGIVLGAPSLALLLAAQSSGRFADQARKPAMIAGMAVIAVSDLGTAMSTSLVPLVLARLGLGLGRCISESGERGMLADFAKRSPELRGRLLSIQQAVLALGIAVGAPLGGWAVDSYGAQAAFLCVSAAATATLGLYFLLPETVVSAESKAEGEAASSAASAGNRWPELLAKDEWRGLALCECGVRFGFAAKIAAIPILAAATFDGGASAAGALLSATGLAGLIGAPAGGWLTDRAGARATALISGGLSGAALLMIPIALHWDSSAAFGALVLLWGVGAAAQGPALVALAQQNAPEGSESEALALPRAAGDGIYILAPLLLGIASDTVPITGIECAVAGAATLLGGVSLARLVKD